jgi:exopolysaccharide biosynthesis polyprenyl glycosylphosphotransferase
VVARFAFYVAGLGLAILLVVALWSPAVLRRWLKGTYQGMVTEARPWRQLASDPPTLVWLAIGLAALLFSAIGLKVTGRRRPTRTTVLPPTKVTVFKWRRVYATRVGITDLISTLWAVLGAQLIWFGAQTHYVLLVGDHRYLPYRWVSLAMAVGWMVLLQAVGSRDPLVYGEGITEYQRVVVGTMWWFAVVVTLTVMFKIDFARGYLLVVFPCGLLALLISRKVWRVWLVQKRQHQQLYTTRALVAGSADRVVAVVEELRRNSAAGYSVNAVALPQGETPPPQLLDLGVPVVTLEQTIDTMHQVWADSLVVAGAPELDPEAVKNLSWQLRPGIEHLIMAPSMVDIAGPRVATRPVAGLSLIHIESPRFSGAEALLKRAFDLVTSAVALILLAVPFAVIAVLIKLGSKGPVLFKQERVGLHGETFRMLKFRSMVVNAEQLLDQLDQDRDAGNEVLFKIKDDPRVTKVGRVLRRFSIDELPQLLNVFGGSMSLVGPRPPLPVEVEQYTASQVARRFLVKPGITGLWQVSGRSDLSWDASIRLDLYYVENWSLLTDLQILFRTVKVVFGGEGAY